MTVLTAEQVDARLAALDGWSRDGDAIVKTFARTDFAGAIDFVNRLAPIAEQMNHHPDIEISWDKVTLLLSTHSEGGVTESDLDLAARADDL